MDTDVEVVKPFDKYLDHNFVSSVETFANDNWHDLEKDVDENGLLRSTGKPAGHIGVQAGFMYSKPHQAIIKDILQDVYEDGNKQFVNSDGSFNQIIVDGVLMDYLHRNYELNYRDKTQQLADDICIYDSGVFSSYDSQSDRTCTIHWYNQSWNGDLNIKSKIKVKIKSSFPTIWKLVLWISRH